MTANNAVRAFHGTTALQIPSWPRSYAEEAEQRRAFMRQEKKAGIVGNAAVPYANLLLSPSINVSGIILFSFFFFSSAERGREKKDGAAEDGESSPSSGLGTGVHLWPPRAQQTTAPQRQTGSKAPRVGFGMLQCFSAPGI